ncbi:MAG: N-acetylmuramoyl-L-alanine amidase [Oscillospiraceae bacterium]|nr:N-acetylmuramoyl-L-alanine amidase [Oscillospiraceae bacterium]
MKFITCINLKKPIDAIKSFFANHGAKAAKPKKLRLMPIIIAVFALSGGLLVYKAAASSPAPPVSANTGTVQSTQEQPASNGRLVIVDAGHGGVDGGAESKSGIVEKNVNLAIAKELQKLLTDAKYKVIMTREEDVSIHDEDAKTIRQQKKSDLNNRLQIMKDNPEAVFVSIHQNILQGSTKASGAQVFYSKTNPKSAALAQSIQNAFNGTLQPENNKLVKSAGKNIYILYYTESPAVMAECGFLSNPDEAEKLNTAEYQKQVAKALFEGIEKYYAAPDEITVVSE